MDWKEKLEKVVAATPATIKPVPAQPKPKRGS